MLKITVSCIDDGQPIEAWIDDKGDPSVGIQPSGLENLEGTCAHVEPMNRALEENGEDTLNAAFPAFAGALQAALDALARAEAEADAAAEAAEIAAEQFVPDESPVRVRLACNGEWVAEGTVTFENIESDFYERDVLTFTCPACGQSHRSLRVA